MSSGVFLTKAAQAPSAAGKVRVFAVVSDGDELDGEWREFPDAAARDRLSEARPLHALLDVCRAMSGFRYVSTRHTSRSGDWYHYVDYCYRADGSLAWMESDLRTFYGNVRRVRVRRFDVRGQVVASVLRVFDLITDEPADAASFSDRDDPIHRTFTELPVARLLDAAYTSSKAATWPA